MGITGAWAQKARTDYTGATRWGTGYDPIHETRDNGSLGRVIGAKATLYPLGQPADVVQDTLTGRDIDFVVEDYVDATIPGEYFRYQEEWPRWDETTQQFRDSAYSPAMGEWAPWGVYNDDNPVDGFPLSGPPGGSPYHEVTHDSEVERQHMIAVPTMPVHGGWLSKNRGALAVAESQEIGDPTAQWAVGTAAVQGQGRKELANDRAVERGTDRPRAGILSRVAGMAEKAYARSFQMGGGAGTPNMFPFQQTAGLKRPFLTRAVALAPPEDHFMNTLEQRTPLQRAVPADPYQGDPEVGAGQDASYQDWGY